MMKTTKVRAASTFLSAAVLASYAMAAPHEKVAPTLEQDGFRRMTLGALKITALSDGTVARNVNKLITKIPPADADSLVADGYRAPEIELSINEFLVDNGKQRILIDTGAGDLFKPEAGLLPRSLKQAGYSADRIDVVILTHIHADHSGGLVQGGKKLFPNAKIYIPQKDADLFLTKGEKAKAPKEIQHIWDDAEKTIGPYAESGQTRTFTWNTEIVPGISSLPALGHTPGHSVIVVSSEGRKLVVLGDTVHVAEVQFPHPEAAVMLDVDQDAAVSQRMRLLKDAAEGGYWVAFDHVSFPGIGHIRKGPGDRGFIWVPKPFAVQE